jgi:diguanylate cyclase (GGDEF)-like protein
MTSSIRTRLTATVLTATLLAVGVIVGLLVVISDLARAARDLERLASRIAVTDRLQLELSRLLVPLNDYLLTEDVSRRDAFDRSIVEISRLLAQLQSDQADGEWRSVAQEIHDHVTHLSTLAVEVLFVEHPVGNPQVVRLMNTVNRLSDEVITKAARFHHLAEAEIALRKQRAAAQATEVNRLLVALAIAVPSALGIFYTLLTRWVTVPLTALYQGVLALRAGRTARLTIRGRDEIGEVAAAFNELAEHLAASQEEVQRRTRQLEALYTASRALSKESSRDVLYQTLTDLACSLTDAQYAVLVLFNDQERIIQMIESGVPPFLRWSEDERKAVIAALPHSHQPLRIENGETHPRLQGVAVTPPISTLLAVPVLAEASLRAQLYLLQKRRDVFSSADEDLVVRIANDAAQSLRVIALHEETERLATIDSLTGFVNRWAFEDRLADEFLRAVRHGRPFALIFIDLDNLKAINDKFGHAAGDAAIRRFCDAIRSVIRTTDVVGRYGGDEILALMPETTLSDAMMAAERILRRVTGLPLTVEQERIALSASLGVAAYPEHGRDKESLLRAADFALYQAKAAGRGRVHTVKPRDRDASSPEAA